jgi:splicing factor 3A subunit 3
MQSGIVERIRQLHADVEQHRAAIVKQLMVPASNFRHELLISHFVLHQTRQIATKSEDLLDLYEDDDYAAARDQQLNASEAMREFEGKAAQLREYHRAHPQPPAKSVLEEPSFADGYVEFDASERHGRCLALQQHYSRYMTFVRVSGAAAAADRSATGVRLVDKLIDFEDFILRIAEIFQSTPSSRKLASLDTYAAFVVELLRYVEGFFKRIRPLHRGQVALMIKDTGADFERAWAEGAVPGWERAQCGGNASAKKAALAEAFTECYLGLMPDVLQKTYDFTVRSKTKTVDEIEKEMEEEEEKLAADYQRALNAYNKQAGLAPTSAVNAEAAADDAEAADEDAEDDKKFNKKNFPLDAEGKPIPVWLYHLHGLHIKKPCEICMHTYFGETAYTSHFRELRHTKGLQRLGINENVPELALVASRKAALEIWARLRERKIGTKARHVSTVDDEQVEGAGGIVTTKGAQARM